MIPPPAMPMKTYVLCNWHSRYEKGTFVCAMVGGSITYDPTPGPAARFGSIEEALAYRRAIANQLNFGAHKYRVHELLSDGGLVDVEPSSRRRRL
jgi:hypothetical protein